MSPIAQTPLQSAPFEVFSIRFDFDGNGAVRLKNPTSDAFVSTDPEWFRDPARDEPAAFIRGTRPAIEVVFRGDPSTDGIHTIGADGTPVQVAERQVDLTFSPSTQLSEPKRFELKTRLPDAIGLHPTKWDWYVRDRHNPSQSLPAGTSTHRIGTTWRPMTVPTHEEGWLDYWVYSKVMEWTCSWAAGRNTEKEICDALITKLHNSGLVYGIERYTPRDILLHGGGMCNAWYQFFQQMCHCQGVYVHRRSFGVHLRNVTNGEEWWHAIVVKRPGLNQTTPQVPDEEFHDNDTAFRLPAPTTLCTRVEPRYVFWGDPSGTTDGHCINYLEFEGVLYVYDASFQLGPRAVAPPLPPDDFSIRGGLDLSSFKAGYLNDAVEYMLGSLYNGSGPGAEFLQTQPPPARVHGMTVQTRLIPDTVPGNDCVTFSWGP